MDFSARTLEGSACHLLPHSIFLWARDQLQIPVPPALAGRFFPLCHLACPPLCLTLLQPQPGRLRSILPRIHRKHLPTKPSVGSLTQASVTPSLLHASFPALLLPICMCIMRCAYSPPCSPLSDLKLVTIWGWTARLACSSTLFPFVRHRGPCWMRKSFGFDCSECA